MQPTVVDNFISKQSAKDLHAFLRSKVQVNPMGLLSKQLYPFEQFINDPDATFYFDVKLIVEAIQREFGFPEDQISINRVLYQVLREGEELGYHTDAYGGVDGYGVIGYSALLYLTDDYDGGEINFPDHNLKIKPKANSFITFPSNEHYLHEVLKNSADRYSSTLWFNIEGTTYRGNINEIEGTSKTVEY